MCWDQMREGTFVDRHLCSHPEAPLTINTHADNLFLSIFNRENAILFVMNMNSETVVGKSHDLTC